MRFAVLQKDETLPELVKRLYRETQAGSLSRAERALRDQNPGLAAGGGAGGAIVVVPDVPGTTATAQTRDLPDVVGFLLDALGDIVGSLKDVLNTAVDRMEEEAQDTLERATDREFQKAFERHSDVRNLIKEAADAATTRIDRAKVLRAAHQTIVGQLGEDLNHLSELIHR